LNNSDYTRSVVSCPFAIATPFRTQTHQHCCCWFKSRFRQQQCWRI